jgi:hypothetical protein
MVPHVIGADCPGVERDRRRHRQECRHGGRSSSPQRRDQDARAADTSHSPAESGPQGSAGVASPSCQGETLQNRVQIANPGWYAGRVVHEKASRERTGMVRRLWQAWKRVAQKLGDFQARLLLTVFYFGLVAPFALIVRSVSDPLGLKPSSPRGWRPRPPAVPPTVEIARRQF